jgi:hypothetical protein
LGTRLTFDVRQAGRRHFRIYQFISIEREAKSQPRRWHLQVSEATSLHHLLLKLLASSIEF